MRLRKKVLIAVFGAAAVALAFAAARTLFERTEEEVDRGYRGEAAVHPFFALKELFPAMEIPARIAYPRARSIAPRTVDHLCRLSPS